MVDAPAASAQIMVGVQLDREPGRIGDWLADAAAFDASGADALWIGCGTDLDVLALAAALAVVTYRARLVVALPDAGAVPGQEPSRLARTIDTVDRLSHGRLALVADPGHCPPGVTAFQAIPGEPGGYQRRAGNGLDGGDAERWLSTPVPDGRASWQAARARAAELGASGLVVPADPRLLDILRNPDDPGERHDLQVAVG